MGLPGILWNECCRAEIVAHIDQQCPSRPIGLMPFLFRSSGGSWQVLFVRRSVLPSVGPFLLGRKRLPPPLTSFVQRRLG
jgi:hypothetical protein